jgi:hypothetical protein
MMVFDLISGGVGREAVVSLGWRFPSEVLGDDVAEWSLEAVVGVPGRGLPRDDFLGSRGSRDMMRGFGRGRCAMSIVSIKESLVMHVAVGEMMVGRVIVDDTTYDMEPFPNCSSFTALGVSSPVDHPLLTLFYFVFSFFL